MKFKKVGKVEIKVGKNGKNFDLRAGKSLDILLADFTSISLLYIEKEGEKGVIVTTQKDFIYSLFSKMRQNIVKLFSDAEV